MKCGSVKPTKDDEIECLKDEIEQLKEENNTLNECNIGLINVMKHMITMFESVKEEDGEHTLHVSHEALMKLKNEIEKVTI